MVEHHELLKVILDNYGIAEQKGKLYEELEELQQVLKLETVPLKRFTRLLVDEFADVLILIHQIVQHYGLATVLDTMIEHKLHRTIHEMESYDE